MALHLGISTGVIQTHNVTSHPVGLIAQLVLSTEPVSQRSWVQVPFRPEFFSGFNFTLLGNRTGYIYLKSYFIIILSCLFHNGSQFDDGTESVFVWVINTGLQIRLNVSSVGKRNEEDSHTLRQGLP